eukprot:COSAG05_NODE_9203_length_640_cov_0.857671_1_plen_128_part_10
MSRRSSRQGRTESFAPPPKLIHRARAVAQKFMAEPEVYRAGCPFGLGYVNATLAHEPELVGNRSFEVMVGQQIRGLKRKAGIEVQRHRPAADATASPPVSSPKAPQSTPYERAKRRQPSPVEPAHKRQ